MKVIWKISDDRQECPRCNSVLVTFNGKDNICPSCAAREIKRLRRQVAHLTQRTPDEPSICRCNWVSDHWEVSPKCEIHG